MTKNTLHKLQRINYKAPKELEKGTSRADLTALFWTPCRLGKKAMGKYSNSIISNSFKKESNHINVKSL